MAVLNFSVGVLEGLAEAESDDSDMLKACCPGVEQMSMRSLRIFA